MPSKIASKKDIETMIRLIKATKDAKISLTAASVELGRADSYLSGLAYQYKKGQLDFAAATVANVRSGLISLLAKGEQPSSKQAPSKTVKTSKQAPSKTVKTSKKPRTSKKKKRRQPRGIGVMLSLLNTLDKRSELGKASESFGRASNYLAGVRSRARYAQAGTGTTLYRSTVEKVIEQVRDYLQRPTLSSDPQPDPTTTKGKLPPVTKPSSKVKVAVAPTALSGCLTLGAFKVEAEVDDEGVLSIYVRDAKVAIDVFPDEVKVFIESATLTHYRNTK